LVFILIVYIYKLIVDIMKEVAVNEMSAILKIFKTPEKEFNANSISKEIMLTPMGALKILKRLEKENVLVPKVAGKATFYSINFSNDYAKDYVEFALRTEAEHSSSYVKRWISEVRKLKNADAAILFGSVIKNGAGANDIDVLLVTSQNKFEKLKKEISGLNNINEKGIHAVYQTSEDLVQNIRKGDKIVLNALKGVVVFGEKELIEMIR